jgi:hypothetical protein
VANAPANTTYFVKVQSRTPIGQHAGNYGLTVLISDTAAPVQSFAQGSLGAATQTQTGHLYVATSQLFQFVLSVSTAVATDASVRIVIRDAAGSTVFRLSTRAGQTNSGTAVFLPPGTYNVTVTEVPGSSGSLPDLTYRLRGANIGEPIGPAVASSTLAPQFTSPSTPGLFKYPPNVVTASPFFFFFPKRHVRRRIIRTA